MGIKYREEHLIKANNTILVVASIEKVILEKGLILEDGLIDHSLANSVAVNGLDSYYTAERLKRFSYPRPNEKISENPW